MDEPTTIHDFAERYSMDVGQVMFAVLKYLMLDPSDINGVVRRTLLTATDDEIVEALETMADDLKTTNSKDTMQ